MEHLTNALSIFEKYGLEGLVLFILGVFIMFDKASNNRHKRERTEVINANMQQIRDEVNATGERIERAMGEMKGEINALEKTAQHLRDSCVRNTTILSTDTRMFRKD